MPNPILGIAMVLFAAACLSSCGSEQKREPQASGKPTPPSGASGGRSVDTSIGSRLPGPPGSAQAPTSTDPEVRAVEDRLFKSDGGRVVLRSIRSHGGWRAWIDAAEVRAKVVEEASGQVRTGPPEVAEVRVRPSAGASTPASGASRSLAAPFSFARPDLSLDYDGVVVESTTGDTYDMVTVFEDKPAGTWCIAYFIRRTGILARILEPESDGKFRRIDLLDHREVGGLWMPSRLKVYLLPYRFSRPDLEKPDRIEVLEVAVEAGNREARSP